MTNPSEPTSGQSAPANCTMATVALVLGIIGLITAVLLIGSVVGLAGVVLGIVALVKISSARGGLRGKGKAIAAIILGVLSIPVAIGTLFAIFAMLLQPALERAREIKAQANLKQLGNALQMYAGNNVALAAPHLSTLYTDGDILGTGSLFVDPRSGQKPPTFSPTMTPDQLRDELDKHCDFVYTYGWEQTPGPTGWPVVIKLNAMNPSDIVLYSRIPASNKQIIVLRADGGVDRVTPEEFTENLQRINETRRRCGLAPLPESLLTPPK